MSGNWKNLGTIDITKKKGPMIRWRKKKRKKRKEQEITIEVLYLHPLLVLHRMVPLTIISYKEGGRIITMDFTYQFECPEKEKENLSGPNIINRQYGPGLHFQSQVSQSLPKTLLLFFFSFFLFNAAREGVDDTKAVCLNYYSLCFYT